MAGGVVHSSMYIVTATSELMVVMLDRAGVSGARAKKPLDERKHAYPARDGSSSAVLNRARIVSTVSRATGAFVQKLRTDPR